MGVKIDDVAVHEQVFVGIEYQYGTRYISISEKILSFVRYRRGRCLRAGNGLKTTRQSFIEMCRMSHSRAQTKSFKSLRICRKCPIGRWNTRGHSIIPNNIELLDNGEITEH